jgi:hypothetical protein
VPLREFRLPLNAIPQKYELVIKMSDYNPFNNAPNDAAIFYNGEVTITFNLNEETDTILLHKDSSILLNQTNVRLQSVATGNFQTVAHSYYDENVDLYQVKANSQLTTGAYKLSFTFLSETKLDGFFKSNYVEFGTSR